MCLTFGRPRLLEEALQSFLAQDYPGLKELVILNDFSDQVLVFDHPHVKMVNVSQRFRTVGEKRNACAAFCSHDILFVWDDDDIYLPWRMSFSINRLDKAKGFYKPSKAWVLSEGVIRGVRRNLFHSGSCFTRSLFDQVGGYPHIGSGQDWGLESKFSSAISGSKDDESLTDEELFYIYRWGGTGSFHLSAFGRDEGKSIKGNEHVATYVRHAVKSGQLPTGKIQLHPVWRNDYAGLLPTKTDSSKSSFGEHHQQQLHPLPSGSPNESHKSKESPLNGPLISCVMPTYGRSDYVSESLSMFLAQDYPNKELIILNDCPGQELLGDYPGVTIVNSPTRWNTLGEKRNAAVAMAKGEYIAVWDDDDIYMPWRLSYCMQRIQLLDPPVYCPAEYWAYWGDSNMHHNQAVLNWIYHPQMIFKKSEWDTVGGYPAVTLQEDTAFVRRILSARMIEWTPDPVAINDRVLIMRGKSKYFHTSIDGGGQQPDILPGERYLAPSPISDPLLAAIAQKHISDRMDHLNRLQALDKLTIDVVGDNSLYKLRYLCDEKPVLASVGYGEVGVAGDLGYEHKAVSVLGRPFAHAISAHAVSRLQYKVGPNETEFRSLVAINDDVSMDATAADFMVLCRGVVIGVAKDVRPHETPRLIVAPLEGCEQIELVAVPQRWEHCHTVWLNPVVLENTADCSQEFVRDCLGRARIRQDYRFPSQKSCFVTTASAKFSAWVDDLFGSIRRNAQCDEAGLAVFSIGDSDEVRAVALAHGADVIPCESDRPLSVATKSILYSSGRSVNAENIICLDADMLVLRSLRDILSAIEAAPLGTILVCREANWGMHNFGSVAEPLYKSTIDELANVAVCRNRLLSSYPLIVNDGLFAGKRASLNALDSVLRSFHSPSEWIDASDGVPWRNQAIFNLALAYLSCGQELNPQFNVQLHAQKADFAKHGDQIVAESSCLPVAVAHFSGTGRGKFPEFRGTFRRILTEE
jgi:glycosyltransferase involved in cell wall biosynthesis